MKVYMHWDMEGVSGLFTREQVWYWEAGVRPQVARQGLELITADADAAARAALEAGADEVIVCDTHHGGGNILLDEIAPDPRITYHGKSRGLENGKPRWMPGLDESVDGLMLMGHHAKAGTPDAFLPHTWTLEWADFRINDRSVGEIGIETCYAGYWDIPLVLVQGEETGCGEAEALCPGAIVAPVKRAVGRDTCAGLDAPDARRWTAQKVAEAVELIRQQAPRPYKPALPMTVAVRMTSADGAENAVQKTGARRVDDYTVEARVDRQCDVVKWINGTGLP